MSILKTAVGFWAAAAIQSQSACASVIEKP
ncbi:MAG: hypothetical protein QOG63_2241, partial [Thermoleophilaceae bacterium]|nr:hypothetical protein [Thermoleophilaceae bacterium]